MAKKKLDNTSEKTLSITMLTGFFLLAKSYFSKLLILQHESIQHGCTSSEVMIKGQNLGQLLEASSAFDCGVIFNHH